MTRFILGVINCLLISSIDLSVPKSSRNHRNLENRNVSSQSRVNQNSLKNKNVSWKNHWCTIKSLTSLYWPREKSSLKFMIMSCVCIICIGRGINYYVPTLSKMIVDSISSGAYRWDLIILSVVLKFFQRGATGGIGLLNNIRSQMWIDIQQYSSCETEIKLFRHLHSLNLQWHLSRKTGEIAHVVDRGIESAKKLLDTVFFSILPTIFDVILTVISCLIVFGRLLGLIVLLTVIAYVATVHSKWSSKFNRSMNSADKARKAHFQDSLLNFESVKYYGAESMEVDSYRQAILEYQHEEYEVMKDTNMSNLLRNIIITLGLLIGSLLSLHMVVHEKDLTIGDYVSFTTSIIQLYVPLNSFGNYYGAVRQNAINVENMLNLLQENQKIQDAPNAAPLQVSRGQVEFSNVSFSYTSERPVLKNISFIVPSGKTIAIVGPSGSGKSTIIRLLFRLYDVDAGSILIDDQDIKTVQQESLRKSIGVVPQDTVLFNNTIRYNIQYGKFGSSEEKIIAAAKDADIHERILTFPDGYEEKVGERGLRLSGGEKQRIAIARMILKAPKIVLLDEATSALDTQTERNIYEALKRIHANCTTMIVAHRLSTIIHADEILVLKDGEIVERGRHENLITLNGVYQDMWKAQQNNDFEINDKFKSNRYVVCSICLIGSTLLLFSMLRRLRI